MSVIIRLQNLPWAANAADIRQYFQGLSIPEGGVHIVGGEKGDAFISFSTDEDARQAMLSDGGCIKDVQIRLLLSSRNEMQKVIETARQQTMQFTQVYIQQMQQPQLTPMVGSLPPLTAKVLPQPQQQVRPDRLVAMMRRNQPIIDPTALLMQSQEKSQQHLSPKSLENKDRDDKTHKRERTRSKSRDRRSKSSRGGSSRRDRSRSRDRRRRDRSRSRDRHRSSGGRDSSSRGSGGKSHRSKSPPATKGTDGGSGSKALAVGEQQIPFRSWGGQFDNMQQQVAADNHQQTTMTMNAGPGNGGSMFPQFRTPPQPPIIPILTPNSYTQQPLQQPSQQSPQKPPQQPPKNNWGTIGGEERQKPYVPDNDFRSNNYGTGGSDDEDDRLTDYDNNIHRRFNDNVAPAMRRGPPGQDFHDYQGFNPNKGPRFYKAQLPVTGGQQNRGGFRPFDEYGGGGGPRYNQQPRYGGGGDGGQRIPDGSGGGHRNPDGDVEKPSRFSSVQDGGRPSRFNPMQGGGRPSRFSSIQDGGRPSRFSSIQDGGRPSRFNPVPQRRDDNGGPDFDDSKKLPPRYNDRYKYDTEAPRAEGLCIELNNMVNHFSYGDVRKLFEGIHIDGSAIKIQKHRQGVAFVRFDSNYNKNLALKMNGTSYKGSYIVVRHLDDDAYERENTDDRPYPTVSAAATTVPAVPTVVDHVDLVDLVDDEDDDKPEEDNNKQDTKQQKTVEECSDDDCNLVVCEKNVKDVVAKDGSEEQPSSSSSQKHDPPTKYLKLKQLPVTVTEEDILNEIGGGGEIRRVTFYPDDEFMSAVLEFHNIDEAEAALKRFDCVLLGSTPVPVLRCTYKEYVQIKRKSGGGGKRFSGDNSGGGGGSRHHHHSQQQQHPLSPHSPQPMQPPPPLASVGPVLRSNCLYVYGLPTSVTNTDITQFFADISVLPDKIHIMLSKFGRPTGESYCEFSTTQQAQTALAKDQQYMGPNLVNVELISRSDMIQAITKPMQQHNNHHQNMSWGIGMRGGVGGGPPRQQHNVPRQNHHQGPQSSYGGGNRPHQQQYMNNGGRGVGGYTPRMRGPPGLGPNTGPDGFGQPGCVVALDNVPYRASVQEIVDFFDGFDLNLQNVIRRFNDFGKPTGEARVNLRNPQEAIRAIRMLQNKPIFNRPVQLTLL